MANEIQLTAEQLHYISKLPKRTVIVGGKEQTLACDLKKEVAFFLDDAGRPTGRASKLNDSTISAILRQNDQPAQQTGDTVSQESDIPQPKITSRESESNDKKKTRIGLGDRLRKLAGASDAEITRAKSSRKPAAFADEHSEDEDEPQAGKKPGKRKKHLLLIFIPIIIAVLGFTFVRGQFTATEPAFSSIDVIQVTKNFIPGDPITENDIKKATISAETYNQISLSGATLYQWTRSDSLLNACAASFIPAGQYLTYENVDAIYHQAVNPWTTTEGDTTYVTLPLTEELIQADTVGYGSIVDLTITRTTMKTSPASKEEDENKAPQVPGLERKATVEQSSLLETYSLPNVVVCDLLNSDKNSLYATYNTWISIPAGERSAYLKERLKEDSTSVKSMLPTYAQVRMTKAQAEALGDLTAPDVSVEIGVTDKVDANTDAKSAFAAEANAFTGSIRSLLKETTEAEQN